jgi:hypothetical protein
MTTGSASWQQVLYRFSTAAAPGVGIGHDTLPLIRGRWDSGTVGVRHVAGDKSDGNQAPDMTGR